MGDMMFGPDIAQHAAGATLPGECPAAPQTAAETEKSPNARMEYYVLAVKTGREARYLSCAERLTDPADGRFVWPRRALSIRRDGMWIDSVAPLYPGYIFWETRELSDRSIMALRKSPGFIKFLRSNYDIAPLDKRERELFVELIAGGEVIRKSKVVFDENNRIRVVDGPLMRLEGRIVKVDRRKGRARVALTFHGRTMLADLGFEVMEKTVES